MIDPTLPVEVEDASNTEAVQPDEVSSGKAIGAPLDEASSTAGAEETLDVRLPERPTDIPEKFWDPEAGSVRTEALLKSYLQLEKKLGAMVPLPSDEDPDSQKRLQRLLGQPETPEDYKIEAPHELISSDPEINSKLHDAGLTSKQAQLVYDLAAEHMMPIIEQATADADRTQELTQLTSHFGGEQAWRSIAPQIKSWAEANLSDDVYAALSTSFDGVVAIHQMMQNREPSMISEAAVPSADVDKGLLNQMMRDPKYWRDHDPAFVARVTEGYKRLYG